MVTSNCPSEGRTSNTDFYAAYLLSKKKKKGSLNIIFIPNIDSTFSHCTPCHHYYFGLNDTLLLIFWPWKNKLDMFRRFSHPSALKTLGYLHRGTFLLKQEGNVTSYLTESDSAGLSPGSDSAVAWPGDLKHVPSWLMQALAASLCK